MIEAQPDLYLSSIEELADMMRQIDSNADFIGREAQRQVDQLRVVNEKASKTASAAARSNQQARRFG